MTNEVNLGGFEQMVLLAILRLGPSAYAASIRQEIEHCAARSVTAGALYTTLTRLEHKQLVTSSFGKPTPQRGGKAKRFYLVTAAGHNAIVVAQRAYRSLMIGLERLVT